MQMASPIILFKRISPNLKLKVTGVAQRNARTKRKKERKRVCETKLETKIKNGKKSLAQASNNNSKIFICLLFSSFILFCFVFNRLCTFAFEVKKIFYLSQKSLGDLLHSWRNVNTIL